MSRPEEQWLLIDFQQLHHYDAFANPDKVGLGRCGCGVDMYWCEFHPHFAEELLKLGWTPPGADTCCPSCDGHACDERKG